MKSIVRKTYQGIPIAMAGVCLLMLLGFRASLRPKAQMAVVFYNVENLFDTIGNPDVLDEDFTPSGKLQWDGPRYRKKLGDLAKVLSSISGPVMPAAIGLCEVENRQVVEDLFRTGLLAPKAYRIIHRDSPDARGIDVALAYDPAILRELHHEAIPVLMDADPDFRTRDILYAKMLAGKDTLHLFVNHWPSRRGGEEASAPRRSEAAARLRAKVDSLSAAVQAPAIIIMGDFNDYPTSPSITQHLKASPDTAAPHGLVNLTHGLHVSGKGTYNFRGEWGMLDQFIVSKPLVDGRAHWAAADTSASIFAPEWLIYRDSDKGTEQPSRTYAGDKYVGGYSDHYPILLRLWRKGG